MLRIPAIRRFIKYLFAAGGTFLLDLTLLYIFVEFFDIQYAVAAACSFSVAVFCNYIITRRFVFTETTRGFLSGGLYFFLIAFIALIAITSSLILLVEILHWNYFLARIAIASVVGTSGYVLNLLFNFKLRDSIRIEPRKI